LNAARAALLRAYAPGGDLNDAGPATAVMRQFISEGKKHNMARESQLWNWLSVARHQFTTSLQIYRIENLLGAGIPDVEGFLRLSDCSGQFWLELKSSERPKKKETPIRFRLEDRDAQILFMRRRWEMGGNAFFLLQVGSGRSDRSLFLAPGDLGDKLKAGLTESDLAIHCCNTGFFPTVPGGFQKTILERVIKCRNFRSLTPR